MPWVCLVKIPGLMWYVDPGEGFVFLQNTSAIWGLILGVFGLAAFFFRSFFRMMKKFSWIIIAVILVCAGGLIMHRENTVQKKIILVGIDGMDPVITERLMEEGKLPNFSLLKNNGGYSRLNTTIPSESVVAWTSFAAGVNPGNHGIFDFIMRDPSNYTPFLSLNETPGTGGGANLSLLRKADPFWKILTRRGVPSYIYFCPNTFPPDVLKGVMLSGMGVPDLYGTLGRYLWYTTSLPREDDSLSRGKIIRLSPSDTFITAVYGPKVALGSGKAAESESPMKIVLFPGENKIQITLDRKTFFLSRNEWSGWHTVSFTTGFFRKARGIVRFYLKSVSPDFELYCSPVNFDPRSPVFPLSYPARYSREVAARTGLYYTQGMPVDTWALNENRLDDRAFLGMVDEILAEKERIMKEEIKKFKAGVFFFYFETLDAVQHMFWSMPPGSGTEEKSEYPSEIVVSYYEKMDRVIGDFIALAKEKGADLIVISDHGFTSFHTSVHVNRWLADNNYLFLTDHNNESGGFFENVDWKKTKAYAVGFGGIFLNKKGREARGIVTEDESRRLKQSITEGLLGLKDPATYGSVVRSVYDGDETFKGTRNSDAPDLYVGFNAGYRASWQTALGAVPAVEMEKNSRRWNGDHLVDPSLVPGVIFSNKKMTDGINPCITDVAATVLDLFPGKPSVQLDGKNLFKNAQEK